MMKSCNIRIWANPSGFRELTKGRPSPLLSDYYTEIRSFDAYSTVVTGTQYASVLFTDVSYVACFHFVLDDSGIVLTKSGQKLSFRDPKTIIAVAVPRKYRIDDFVSIFSYLRNAYMEMLRSKVYSLEEIGRGLDNCLPEWERYIASQMSDDPQQLPINASRSTVSQNTASVIYGSPEDLNLYLADVCRPEFRGYQFIFFVPEGTSTSLPQLPVPAKYKREYTVVFPDESTVTISSLSDNIDKVIEKPYYQPLAFKGKIADHRFDWAVEEQEQGTRFKILKKMEPERLVYSVLCNCKDSGTIASSLLSAVYPDGNTMDCSDSKLSFVGEQIGMMDSVHFYVKNNYSSNYRLSGTPEWDKDAKQVKVEVIPICTLNKKRFSAILEQRYKRPANSYRIEPSFVKPVLDERDCLSFKAEDADNVSVILVGTDDYKEKRIPFKDLVSIVDGTGDLGLEKIEGVSVFFVVKGKGTKKAFSNNCIYLDGPVDKNGRGRRLDSFEFRAENPTHSFDQSVYHQLSNCRDACFEASLPGYRTLLVPCSALCDRSKKVTLHFKPTLGTWFKLHLKEIVILLVGFLLGGIAGYGLSNAIHRSEQKKQLHEELTTLLNNKFRGVDFTKKEWDDFTAKMKENGISGLGKTKESIGRYHSQQIICDSLLAFCQRPELNSDVLKNFLYAPQLSEFFSDVQRRRIESILNDNQLRSAFDNRMDSYDSFEQLYAGLKQLPDQKPMVSPTPSDNVVSVSEQLAKLKEISMTRKVWNEVSTLLTGMALYDDERKLMKVSWNSLELIRTNTPVTKDFINNLVESASVLGQEQQSFLSRLKTDSEYWTCYVSMNPNKRTACTSLEQLRNKMAEEMGDSN